MNQQSLCVLGSTGSIGQNTLDVVQRHPDRFKVHALTAYSRVDTLIEQALVHQPAVVVLPSDDTAQRFKSAWPTGRSMPEVRVGSQALVDTASDHAVTTVMAAIVGAAGLPSALAAARAGKRVLLANKEALVAAGHLFMRTVRESGAQLLPIDSEHNAIFQCLPGDDRAYAPARPASSVRRLLVTASGGPFRTTPLADLHHVTPEQACAHPNWSMGRKISVDSSTMLNKGLEVIEAHWLFAMPASQIQVVVHPQSVVHSMVEYADGSVLAQLGQPDMRTPIAYGLGFPERIESGVGLLQLTAMGRLDFYEPDLHRFPCLALAYQALNTGQAACIALNAANEVAVEAFLQRQIRYTAIAQIIEHSLSSALVAQSGMPDTLEAILSLDQQVRAYALNLCRTQA